MPDLSGNSKKTMSTYKNGYLDAGSSDSDHEEGYDSEAAEFSKDRFKRRKLSPSLIKNFVEDTELNEQEQDDPRRETLPTPSSEKPTSDFSQLPAKEPVPSTKPLKAVKLGVVYLSSLPPYLKPSALRNLLTQRGFAPITRLFLAPSSKAKNHHSAKKSSRQLYTEGWIEFASRKIAKRCAETLNATTVGGRKGGFYHDDIWNMKYLRGVGWDDLMAQVREERREEEVRRTEERGQIARETKEFLEGVERGKMTQGIEISREKKRKKVGAEDSKSVPDERRRWRQYKVKGGGSGGEKGESAVSEDVKRVLSKIF
jgi:ESF2/ABP1 family protein